jgi:glycosyltransferase involved in cell wall biosynthesis
VNILHTNFLHGWGGQSNRILNVCRGLAERGHGVLIAAPGDSELVRRAATAGLPVEGSMQFRRGFRPRSVARDVAIMRRLLRRRQFDLIHTHGSQDSWITALANLPKRRPVVRTKHNVFPIRDHAANRWLYGRFFDRLICNSTAIVEQCAAKPYIERGKLARIYSAVDLGRFTRPDPEGVASLRSEWGNRRPVLVLAARLRPEKGHQFLLEAVGRLRRNFPRILLVLAGDGSLRPGLEQQAASLGIADHVRFLGLRNDIPEILATADLFILPSLSEGIGTAAIEACAAGLPVVSSRVGGMPEVILDGVTGRLVEAGNVDELTEAVAGILSDPDRARTMGDAAHRHAAENFTIDALVAQTETVYSELLKAGAGGQQKNR